MGQHPGADAAHGHCTVRAALIYQHATDERDREIADSVNELIERHRQAEREGATGPTDGESGAAEDAPGEGVA